MRLRGKPVVLLPQHPELLAVSRCVVAIPAVPLAVDGVLLAVALVVECVLPGPLGPELRRVRASARRADAPLGGLVAGIGGVGQRLQAGDPGVGAVVSDSSAISSATTGRGSGTSASGAAGWLYVVIAVTGSRSGAARGRGPRWRSHCFRPGQAANATSSLSRSYSWVT